MNKSATVRARIDPRLKKKVETLFKKLGLSTTQAITLFYQQVSLNNGLPFNIVIPNATTLKTFEDTDAGKNLVAYDDIDEMFEKLGL